MESREEAFFDLVYSLQNGYYAGRMTQGNERLAFVLVMVAVTKQSIPQVLKIQKNHFVHNNAVCILRIHTVRANNLRRISIPEFMWEYVTEYCTKFHVTEEGLLFPFNPEYVGNRVRELTRIKHYDISVRDIMKLIPYHVKTTLYQDKVKEYLWLLYSIPLAEAYSCNTANIICDSILKFMKTNLI